MDTSKLDFPTFAEWYVVFYSEYRKCYIGDVDKQSFAVDWYANKCPIETAKEFLAKKLNKTKTGNKIIAKCQASKMMSIDVEGFWKKTKTSADFKEACEFCRVEPVYE